MQLIVRVLDALFPSRAILLDLEERIDSIEWRLSCLEARAAQESFEGMYRHQYVGCSCDHAVEVPKKSH